MQDISFELRDLQREITGLRLQAARLEGELYQLRLASENRAWQLRWQNIAFVPSSGILLVAFCLFKFLFG